MELSFDDDIRLIQAEMKLRTALVKRALVLEKNRHKGAANRLGSGNLPKRLLEGMDS